jgi:hypothetical protein
VHRELVAAEASDRGVGRDGAAQPLGDNAQQAVAGSVAECVVDLLEPVEVEQQHCRAVRVVGVLRDAARQVRPVGQPGECVMVRVEGEALDHLGAAGGDCEVPGQRLQQRQVVPGERCRVAEPVDDRDGARDGAAGREVDEHRVAVAALSQPLDHCRVAVVAGREQRLVLGQGPQHRPVGDLSGTAVDAESAVVGAELGQRARQ